jgi:hypothetical protein
MTADIHGREQMEQAMGGTISYYTGLREMPAATKHAAALETLPRDSGGRASHVLAGRIVG